jgi:hypothetical protein
MNMFAAILIFIFILIIYGQIMFQLKKGDDLEIYETDFTSNKDLNDSANLKQPFVFSFGDFDNSLKHISFKADYGNFDVFVKDIEDYHADKPSQNVLLTLNAASALINTDADSKYFSDSNSYFIEETGIQKYYNQFDKYLKPHFSVFSKYDMMFGSSEATTPLTYHTYERRFFYVTGGKIRVKMTPWRSEKYMIVNKNYKDYEFTSPLNVWKPQEAYLGGFQKMKFLDFSVSSGNTLYIPPFWHYSIQFPKNENNTLVHVFSYGSLMNVCSNLFNLSNHYYDKLVTKKDHSSENDLVSTGETSSVASTASM